MAEVLVAGGGFGGIPCALELRRLLPREHPVTLVDAKGRFTMGLRKLWALDGRATLEAGSRDLALLERRGVGVVKAPIERIDVPGRTLSAGGRTLRWDHLVLALGASLAPAAVPGLPESLAGPAGGTPSAYNLYDSTAIDAARRALERFAGGRLVVAIFATPFKCPPAPYEAAMLLGSFLARRGLRSATRIALSTPEPHPLPIAPPEHGAVLTKALAERGIRYLPNHKPRAVHPEAREVEYEDGTREGYDVLLAVPPHRAPPVLRDAGLLNEAGWLPVDPRTLATRHPNVWAIGDCTALATPASKPLPKAGILAEKEGLVVAARIADAIAGRAPKAEFDGTGTCYVELGNGLAVAAQGDFLATPAPRFTFGAASEAALRQKEEFEASRLKAWFGG